MRNSGRLFKMPGPAVAGATTAGNWAIGPKTVLRSVVCRRHKVRDPVVDSRHPATDRELSVASAIDRDQLSPIEEYMLAFLSYTYCAINIFNNVTNFGCSTQTNRAVQFGAFVDPKKSLKWPISRLVLGVVLESYGQILPGGVPCLVPAYNLHQLGTVIDMSSLLIAYTHLSVVQNMSRRPSGHVAVSLCECGQGWYVPASYDFLKSEIWKVKGPVLKPSPELFVSLVDGKGQNFEMPPSVATLCAALVLCVVHASMLQLRGHNGAAPASQSSTFGSATGGAAEEGFGSSAARTGSAGGSGATGELPTTSATSTTGRTWRSEKAVGGAPHRGRSKFLTPVLRASPTCSHPETKHGCNSEWAWSKCVRCQAVEQVPKMELGKLSEWNSIMVFQPPDYKTPTEKQQDKAAAKEAKLQGAPKTPASSITMSSAMPPVPLEDLRLQVPRRAAVQMDEMDVEPEVPYHILRREIGTPDSNDLALSDRTNRTFGCARGPRWRCRDRCR
eukprot:s4865_g8.t1